GPDRPYQITHTHTHTRAHTCTRTHTHTQSSHSLLYFSPSALAPSSSIALLPRRLSLLSARYTPHIYNCAETQQGHTHTHTHTHTHKHTHTHRHTHNTTQPPHHPTHTATHA